MRCQILAVIVAIGCGHDREPEKRVAPAAVNPPIPPDDDHEDPNAPLPPPRPPCKTPCDTWHDPEYATWSKKCIQTAPGIVVFGQDSMHLAGCSPLRIVIDCCTINRDDTAVARTLGWEHATPDQRVSIAW